jgi:hypothetical protein
MAGIQILHAIEGRLRIKTSIIKNEPRRAIGLAEQLRARRGITGVELNPTTGSVIIFYDPAVVNPGVIYSDLQSILGQPLRQRFGRRSAGPLTEMGNHITRALFKSAMEALVQRAVLALI